MLSLSRYKHDICPENRWGKKKIDKNICKFILGCNKLYIMNHKIKGFNPISHDPDF